MDYASLDHSLRLLRPYGPYLKNGLSNHVPMVAEALCALGASAASQKWVTAHLGTIVERDNMGRPVTASAWEKSLGHADRFAGWEAFFRAEITFLGWRQALDKWSDRLAPGLFASATHGIIRVGHAARALSVSENETRLAELADGLAVWSSTYQELPTEFKSGPQYATVAEAFTHLPLIPKAERNNGGLITDALAPLSSMGSFQPVISWIDVAQDPSGVADQIAYQQAMVFATEATTPLLAIVFTHAITSVHAILNIAPHVSDATVQRLLAYGWQAGAALYAAYVDERELKSENLPDPELRNDIVSRAIEHGDDHVIKLSEACLSFYDRTGKDIFRQVPALARARLAPI